MKILIIEDDIEFAQKCIEGLLKYNFEMFYQETAERGKNFLLDNRVDIMIIDLMLSPTYSYEGVELLKYVRGKYPEVELFMMTAKEKNTTEVSSEATLIGAHYFFDKNSPDIVDKIIYKVRELIMEKSKKIFISHGHNELLKFKLKDFLTNRLKKETIILSEEPNVGLTIVEKLEKASETCCFAIIIMTKDDETTDGGKRARQNVIHEIGFFQGKYGRKNVILLAEQGVEIFSNISGIVRIEFESDKFESVYEPIRVEIESVLGL